MPMSRVRFTSVVEAVRSARGSFTVMLTVAFVLPPVELA